MSGQRRAEVRNSRLRQQILCFVSLWLLALVAGQAAADAGKPPRLIVQISVDALRGDLPKRYAHVLGDGGFRYLMMKQDIDYTNANYQHV